jgi:CYTH domain-containing protein
VLGERLVAAADALEGALAAVSGVDEQEAAHRARVAAKRVRYLVEPVAGAAPGAAEAARELHALQDALGDMHDLHLLWSCCQEGGEAAAALAARLAGERAASFRRLSRGWLGGAAGPLLGRLREVAAALGGAGPDREVERKFLLRRFPTLAGVHAEAYRVDQGYLPGERLVERVRRVRGPAGDRFFRTVKLGSGMTRTEVEEECDAQLFRALWRLTRGRRVSKTRYRVPAGELVWEIDRFHGRRLVLAEVELDREDASVPLPDWLRAVLEREVTGESEYVNQKLAR